MTASIGAGRSLLMAFKASQRANHMQADINPEKLNDIIWVAETKKKKRNYITQQANNVSKHYIAQ